MNKHNLTKIKDSDPLARSQNSIRRTHPFVDLASGLASVLGVLFTAAVSFLAHEGLQPSAGIRIPAEYVPFAASILSAIIGLTVIFVLARAFYKKRVESKARLTKKVRVFEKRFFESIERNFESLVGAHGRR